MRELKFRAKRLDNGHWEYASLFNNEINTIDAPGIGVGVLFNNHPVNKATICQFTGLHDVNGTEIYEHDVVLAPNTWQYEVFFVNGCFGLIPKRISDDSLCNVDGWNRVCEVIRSIYDH